MEEADEHGENTDSIIRAVTMKALDFARNVNAVVGISAVAVSCFFVLYLSSITNNNNFGQCFSGLSASFYSLNNAATADHHLPVDEPVIHDEYYELRIALKAAATEDKTVILTTLNDAWAEPNNMFDLFLESFRIGNNTARLLNHVLVIAVDNKAYSRCQASVRHCYFLKSNYSTEMAHEARFMTPIYLEMMWERHDFLRLILTLGYNFVFTDIDVMWFRDPFPHFYPDVDYQTSCDGFNGDPFDTDNHPNNGFNFVRSNNRTIEFYKFWVSSRWTYRGLNEQNVLNKIKNSSYVRTLGMSMRFLDPDYFGGFCSPSKDFSKVCTMHGNCCVGLPKKLADLTVALEDWRRYVQKSLTTTEPIRGHWRVPNKCGRHFRIVKKKPKSL